MKRFLAYALAAFSLSLATAAHPADNVCTVGNYLVPQQSCPVLKTMGLSMQGATPLIGLKSEFKNCDTRNEFHGIALSGRYRCKNDDPRKSDLNNVAELAILQRGEAYWDAKMAVDVDGSWAAWHGHGDSTTQKHTSIHWPDVSDDTAAQIDPDIYPYIAIPGDDPMLAATDPRKGKWIREFRDATKIELWDMGVVISGQKWTPVIVADIGPINRLGEASSAVHAAIAKNRCAKKTADRKHCASYINYGPDNKIIYIIVPKSRAPDMTSQNAMALMCKFAKDKFNLSGAQPVRSEPTLRCGPLLPGFANATLASPGSVRSALIVLPLVPRPLAERNANG